MSIPRSSISVLPSASSGLLASSTSSSLPSAAPSSLPFSAASSPASSVSSGSLSAVSASISAPARPTGRCQPQLLNASLASPTQSECANAPAATALIGLSANEAAYRSARQSVSTATFVGVLQRLALLNSSRPFSALDSRSALFDAAIAPIPVEASPIIAFAALGSGMPGAVSTAGALSAFDGRNVTAYRRAMGGLLQAATYISAADGAAWAVLSGATQTGLWADGVGAESWYSLAHDWTTRGSLLGPDPIGEGATQATWIDQVVNTALVKAAAGFSSSFADARAQVRASFCFKIID